MLKDKQYNKAAMLLLALYPMLHWYNINLPVGLGEMLIAVFAVFAFAKGKVDLSLFPKTFIIVISYISIMWFINNDHLSMYNLLPGGPVFFFFLVTMIVGLSLFDFDSLKKYMKCIVILSIIIFWIQFLLLHTISVKLCFVPNLTGSFLYEDFSYQELVTRHLNSGNPCAIFLEKSYMAYYLVIYLCIELFYGENRTRFFSKLSLLIIITLIFLRSGSGLIGMSIPVIIKYISYYWEKKTLRYLMLVVSVPFFSSLVYIYLGTEIGAAMFERQSELTTDGTSGFHRVAYGYMFLEGLSQRQYLFGTSISDINNITYLSYSDSNFPLNGIQAPLMQLGIVGLSIWIIFYLYTFVRTTLCGKMCIVVFLILSSIEVIYLGSYMSQLTIIACSQITPIKQKI